MANQYERQATAAVIYVPVCAWKIGLDAKCEQGQRDRKYERLTTAYAFPNIDAFAPCVPYSTLALGLEVEIGLPYSGKIADGGGHLFELDGGWGYEEEIWN